MQIAALRRALGESPGGDRWIETMPRRGYRFVGPVLRTERNDATVRSEPAPKSSMESALALPDKPSIAVLPFQNLSSDPEQEYFTDGMVEEIITALARIRLPLQIVSRAGAAVCGAASGRNPRSVRRSGLEKIALSVLP